MALHRYRGPLCAGLALAAFLGCGSATEDGPPPNQRMAPEVVVEDVSRQHTADVEPVRERAVAALPALVERLPGAEAQLPLRVRLMGEGDSTHVPTVDPDTGTILLYRFPGAGGDYDASLVHEMVHALRLPHWQTPERQTNLALFFEEGLAEVLARSIGFGSTGFPLFGTEPTVAVGHWIETNQLVSPARLARNHLALNFRCMPQAYSIRLSFVDFLVTAHGLDTLVSLTSGPVPVDEASLEAAYGASLDDLVDAWRIAVTSTWQALPEGQTKAEAWAAHPAIAHFPSCSAPQATDPDVDPDTEH